ncbi:hypothetical protein M9H77_18707 [Catharanthus roseus]|uniref:Uncharacterized protein n=1 Tax=Catharanthus roseus TaxID=4058 RepID=A0ACC0B859_CATRO|nr:hypothetical protein M9H77_18707 [Catharanthus roseus]
MVTKNFVFFLPKHAVIHYLKFPQDIVNQAVLHAFQGYDTLDVIEDRKSPVLRIIGIGPPSTDNHNYMIEIANFAQSINIKFSFRGVKNSTLHKIKPWNLQMSEGEVNARLWIDLQSYGHVLFVGGFFDTTVEIFSRIIHVAGDM